MDAVAPFFIGQAHDRCLDDALVREQHVLDLARIDVVAAADEHVVLAVENVDEAVLVHASDVAGMEPTVAESLGGLFRAVPVTGHELGAAADDLALLAGGHRPVVIVEDCHVDGGIGPPARAHAVVVFRPEEGDHHGGFRLTVGLCEDRAEAGHGTLQEARRDRRGAVADALEAEVGGLQRGLLHDHGQHGRHQKRVGRARLRRHGDEAGGVEVRHD